MFKKVKNYFLNKIESLKRFQSQEKKNADRLELRAKNHQLKKSASDELDKALDELINKNLKVYPPLKQSDKYHNIDEPWQEEY